MREKLMSALLGEVESLSVLVITSASLANALAEPIGDRIPHSAFITYMPGDPILYTTAAAELIRANIAPEIMATQQMLHARLTLAKRLSTAYAADPGQVQRDAFADAWQRTCGAAIAAAQALRQALVETTAGRIQPRAGRISDQLKAAQRGEHPSVLSDGSIIIPGWSERRRMKRQVLELDCLIQIDGRTANGRIYDLSTGGLGFSGLTDLKRGEPVTIELPNGRWLTGKVSWCSGDRAGMKFDVSLAHDDPLLPPII